MRGRAHLAGRFAFVGFVAGIAATTFLWWFSESGRYVPVILGLRDRLLLLAFPCIGAGLAAAATLLFNERTFGGTEGGLVALLAFLATCATVAGWGGAGVYGFFAFGFFGFIFFGWALIAAGVLVGRRWHVRHTHAL